MSIASLFRRLLGDVEHAAEAVVHFAEKEFTMSLPQAFAAAIARLKDLLASHTDQSATDAKTISDLQAANADLQSRLDASTKAFSDLQATCATHEATIADLTAQGAAKDAQIADLTSQLSDATAQITDMEAAVLGLAPPAAA